MNFSSLALLMLVALYITPIEALADCDANWVHFFKFSVKQDLAVKTTLASQLGLPDLKAMESFSNGSGESETEFRAVSNKATAVYTLAKSRELSYRKQLDALKSTSDVLAYNRVQARYDELYESDIRHMEKGDLDRFFDDYRDKAKAEPKNRELALLAFKIKEFKEYGRDNPSPKREKFLSQYFPGAAKYLALEQKYKAASAIHESFAQWKSCAKPVAKRLTASTPSSASAVGTPMAPTPMAPPTMLVIPPPSALPAR